MQSSAPIVILFKNALWWVKKSGHMFHILSSQDLFLSPVELYVKLSCKRSFSCQLQILVTKFSNNIDNGYRSDPPLISITKAC